MEKLLTIEGIDVNVKTSLGFAPIHGAAQASPSKYDMMRMLVNAGADLEARTNSNDTAACRSIHTNKKNPAVKVNKYRYIFYMLI